MSPLALCQDDCKGLCVHCGANLNVSPCSCESFVGILDSVELRALAWMRKMIDHPNDCTKEVQIMAVPKRRSSKCRRDRRRATGN